MRAVITRVKSASVAIADEIVGQIGQGFLILLGVAPDDTSAQCKKLADKALGLRVFCDENLTVQNVKFGNRSEVSFPFLENI